MTREELDLLLELPQHQIVELSFAKPKVTKLYKCGFNLTMEQLGDYESEFLSKAYMGVDYGVVLGKSININDKYAVGRITRIITNYKGPRITDWLIQKIDITNFNIANAQESRITDAILELNKLWKSKNETAKLDILFDEYMAAKEKEAAVVNQELDN